MDTFPTPRRVAVSPAERSHLERTHEELCTALTALRSNVALARIELAHEGALPARRGLIDHLAEVDIAVDRLEGLARELRRWHAGLAA